MVTVTLEQAKAIVDLADILKPVFKPGYLVVGILTDGLPIARGLAHILQPQMPEFVIDFIGASSDEIYPFVDPVQFAKLRSNSAKRIYVDWRTKTGKLGKQLKQVDPDCWYAVLSDPYLKADYRATTSDIFKLDWPSNFPMIQRLIGIATYPTTLDGISQKGGVLDYDRLKNPESEAFYKSLYAALDEVRSRND